MEKPKITRRQIYQVRMVVETYDLFLTKGCFILIVLCAGLLSWWRNIELSLHSARRLKRTWLLEANENLLVEVLIHSFTFRHKVMVNPTLPVEKCNQHVFDLCF